MAGEEDLMKQVEELKRKLREVEEEKEEMRRGWEEEENEEMRRGSKEARVGGESRGREEARGGEYRMRESGTGGIASRAMGSAVHMGQLGMDNNNNDRQFYFPNKQQPQDQRYNGGYSTAPQQQPEFYFTSGHLNIRPPRFPMGPAKARQQQPQDQRYNGGNSAAPQQQPEFYFTSGHLNIRPPLFPMGPAKARQQQPSDQRYWGGYSTAPLQQSGPRPFSSFDDDREKQQRFSTEVDYYGGPLFEVFGPPQQRSSTEVDYYGGPLSEVFGPPESKSNNGLRRR